MSSISICKLSIEDVAQYLEVLRNLTVVKTDLNTAKLIYEREIATNPLHHIFIAYTDDNKGERKVIASCTLLVEPKMIG